MAANKAKRPLPSAQPMRHNPNPQQILRPQYGLRISPAGSQPQRSRLHARETAQLMPVKAHVYRTIAELNGGFEKVIQDLQTLRQISFFRNDRVTAMHDLICRVRAQANRDFTMTLHGRELANAGHFDGLCIEWEKQIEDRSDT
ncbi:MAG: hypothetical protein LAP21_11755 [Acidobacteriia bacterium]|nr:hypothetical protein [Terriglobia bacterium]